MNQQAIAFTVANLSWLLPSDYSQTIVRHHKVGQSDTLPISIVAEQIKTRSYSKML